MVKLSIIMPVYNEEQTLEAIVRKVLMLRIAGVEKELIIVDDCSTDNSRKILKKIKRSLSKGKRVKIFYHEKNLGKGGAVSTGLQHATGDILIIQDADLEYNPAEIPGLIKPLLRKEIQVVYGSRFMHKHNPQYPVYYLGNIILSWATTLIFFKRITDMETGYKAFRKEVIKDIKLRSRGFDLEPEITAKILKRGYSIRELPISFKPRKFEEGKKITWKDGVMALFYLLRYRFVE